MADRHIGGCIYCGSLGLFSDEHVVCAGLGGDDNRWLLKSCVCRVCNTEIFSKLETKFLRASPVGVARLFMQDRARDRGHKSAAPSIQPNVTVYKDEQTGYLLAAQMADKGKTTVLPQIIANPQSGGVETAITGSDRASVTNFLESFDSLLVDELVLIEKRRVDFEVVFDLTPLAWSDEAYTLGQASTASKPPTRGIWIGPLTRPATASVEERLPLAVFGLPNGQIVCRASSRAMAGVLLSFLRSNPQVRQPSIIGSVVAFDDQPGVHLLLAIDFAAYDR